MLGLSVIEMWQYYKGVRTEVRLYYPQKNNDMQARAGYRFSKQAGDCQSSTATVLDVTDYSGLSNQLTTIKLKLFQLLVSPSKHFEPPIREM